MSGLRAILVLMLVLSACNSAPNPSDNAALKGISQCTPDVLRTWQSPILVKDMTGGATAAVVTDGQSDCYLVIDAGAIDLALSPNRDYLVYETLPPTDAPTSITVLNLVTNEKFHVGKLYVEPGGPTWSPDGKWIAYICGSSLCITHPDGSEQWTLMTQDRQIFAPKWSPDGKQIAYLYQDRFSPAPAKYVSQVRAIPFDEAQEDVFQADDPHIKTLSPDSIYAGVFSWSPDGTSLLLTGHTDIKNNRAEIYLLTIASRKLTKLTTTTTANECPTYTQDGAAFVFNATTQKQGTFTSQVMMMRVGDSEATPITGIGCPIG